MADQPHTKLSRELGLFTVMMVGVGAMIGAGIFVLTGIAAGAAGPGLIVAFAANGLVTLLTALAYAELGSAIPEAGGGYLWVKQGLPGGNAFLAGWMSWFAHAVAGSLYALGFGSYLGLVLDELGVTIFGIGGAGLEKPLAVLIALAFIGINFKGVSETGLAGNVVTVAKILVILLFIGSGLYHMLGEPASWDRFTPLLPEGLGGVLTAMGLTYVAFEGYEIIVQAGEEVKDPKRNIPRAVFWSLAIVIPIYILVAIAALGAVDTGTGQPTWAWLGQHAELGLAEAARQFMPLGSSLLLIGGLLSTMSALNATTFSSTRVSFAMGRDRNLPDFFARVHERTRTPYLALAASGGLIIFMALAIPIHDVAAAADVMFLLLFLQVNVAIITIRRKYGEALDYGFLIPFFPVLPVIAIVLMLGIAVFMFRFSPAAWYFVLGWIGIGMILYYTYARKRERQKAATPVVLHERPALQEDRYRILVPVANPRRAGALIDFAGMVARERDAEIVLLHVIGVPAQTPLDVGRQYVRAARDEVLDQAADMVARHEVPFSSIIRIAHRPADAIVDEVEEHDIDLVVMGWRGPRRHARTAIGSNIDRVFRHAGCHVAVLRADDIDAIGKVLVPIAYPQQARLMLELAEMFNDRPETKLELFHLVPPDLGEEARRLRIDELYEGLEDLGVRPGEGGHSIRVEESDRVVSRIVHRAADFDLTILGASREGWFHKLIAGTIPERIARRVPGRLLVVKHRRTPIQSWVLDTIDFFRDSGPVARSRGGGS